MDQKPGNTTTKPTLYMPIGVPGSGKTTFLERNCQAVLLSGDVIRGEVFGDESIQIYDPYLLSIGIDPNTKSEKEKMAICSEYIWKNVNERVKTELENGNNVAYDGMNINVVFRKQVIQRYRKIAKIHGIWFQVPVEICIERDRNRNRVVGEEVIRNRYGQIDIPTMEEGFDILDIVDQDGNLIMRQRQ